MVKKILYICLLLSVFSCEKIYINGDLDGMWRMQSVETDDSVAYPDSIFYSFQRHLVMMGIYSEIGHPENMYMGCFTYENGRITMDNFYRYPGSDSISVLEELENLYIYSDTMYFTVEHLGSDALVLSSNGMKYSFRKW